MLEELEKDPEKLAPIYLLVGENSYFLEQFSQRFVQKILPDSAQNLNLIKIEEKEENALSKLQTAAKTISMLGGEKVIEFKVVDLLKGKTSEEKTEKFLEILKNWPRGSYLLLQAEDRVDRRIKTYKKVKSLARIIEGKDLRGKNLHNWIREKAEKEGKKIQQDAILFLEYAFQNQLYILENELKKIFLYTEDEKIITRSQVEKIISRDRVLGDKIIFQWTDAISKRDIPRALEMMGEMLKQGIRDVYMFLMLARQIRLMALSWEFKKKGVPPAKAAKEMGLNHPFPVEKCYSFVDKFSFQELSFLWQEIYEVSRRVIEDSVGWQESMEIFIFKWKNYSQRT